jgi:hypothetical protein
MRERPQQHETADATARAAINITAAVAGTGAQKHHTGTTGGDSTDGIALHDRIFRCAVTQPDVDRLDHQYRWY